MREQETLVDIYFAGRYLLSGQAKYTPNTVTFIDPSEVVDRLPGVTRPRVVEQALSGELPANQELRCYYRGQTNCGVLEPQVAGVIFDSDRFRADVFVNPDYLVVQEAAVPKFLPPSSAGTSFLQNFSYAFGGEDSDFTEESNLYSLSELSWKENAVLMQANYSNREFLDIDTLVGQRDFQGRRYQLGWLLTDSQTLRFAPETDVLGFRFGTSLDTRADLRQSTGRQIEVFLQSRGEVSIFKDGRLLSTRIYDAGNQVLDTSAMPGGAYDIEIRIRDAGGERVERQFYVKNQRLPPKDMPLYFVELGEITRPDADEALPKGVNEYLARGGFNLRLNPGNAIFGGLSTTGDDRSAELGWIGLGKGYDLALSGALARDGRYGIYTEFRVGWHDIFLSGSYRRIWGNDDFEPGALPLLGQDQEQASAQLTIPAGRGRVSLSGRYNDLSEPDTLQTGTIAYELPIRLPGRSTLAFRTSYTYDDGDEFAFAGVRWSLSKGHWSYSANPELAHERADGSTDDYWRGNASANWDSRDLWSSDLRGGVTATHDRDFSTVGGNVDWGGRYGRARFQSERVFRADADDSTRHNGNLATSIVATKGAATFGGKEQNRAAIIIDVTGERDTNAFFDVLVNGSRRGTVSPGSRALLTLTPFKTYRVRLRLKGEDFVYFDDREHEVTLYPGNVVTLSWKAQTVNIVFGRIIDREGNPVGNALLKGVAGLATTDDLGLFQAEISTRAREIQVETRESICAVAIPEYEVRQGVGSVGTLRCALNPKSAPPSE
jgi:outer membrane usher protein FimD/PapC